MGYGSGFLIDAQGCLARSGNRAFCNHLRLLGLYLRFALTGKPGGGSLVGSSRPAARLYSSALNGCSSQNIYSPAVASSQRTPILYRQRVNLFADSEL